MDTAIIDHLVVLLGDRDFREGHAVDALDVVGAEEVHVLVLTGQFEGDVGDDNAQGESLNTDLLIRILALGVEELHDVRVVCVQVDGTRALTCTQLVRVGEGVLEKLHHGNHATGLVLNLLDRGAGLAKVGELQGHATTALGQLQCGVDTAGDGFHIVFDAQKEAGDELASRGLAGVEEGRGCRLETSGHHLIDQVARHLDIALRQVERDHDDAVFKALQVAGSIEGLERVRGVVLEGAQEGREAELVGVGLLVEVLDVLEVVLVQDVLLVVALLDQVFHLLFQVVEEDGVLVDVLEEVLACCLSIGLELDLAVGVVEV